MRFRTGLLFAMLATVAALLAATVGAVVVVLDGAARRDVADGLRRSCRVLEDLQTYRQALFRSQGWVVAEEPRLKAVVAAEEVSHETVLGVAQEMRRTIQGDLFLITDGEGRLLADVASPTSVGNDMRGNPLVAAALATGEASGIWLDNQLAYQIQARRLAFGATVVGVLAVGHRLDDRTAQTVYRQTASSVVFELDGRPLAASPFESGIEIDRIQLGSALAPVPTGGSEPVPVSIGGETYLAQAGPFPGYSGPSNLRYVVLRSLDHALAPSRRLMRILFFVLGIAICTSLMVAVVLSRRLSRPLDQLVSFTRDVGAGKLQTRANLDGPIEVRALGNAMNQMVQELEQSRQQLATKERLEKEMEIATRIQSSMLPQKVKVEGLQLAARMVPASEVGGDYYDVIPVQDGCWLGIGDVAGHGLTAGLVMLMVQNVVAAITRLNPETTPRDIIRCLNDVLFENIRHRLGRNEHVTVTLIRYSRNGHLVFAGAHEDILVCRAADGRCERLPTAGTWVGATRDVGRFTVDTGYDLNDGDLLVLYTDGVTEAMNAKGEQFGIERFCAEIERVHNQPVEQVRDHIFDLLHGWTSTQTDDVTLLVLRHQAAGSRNSISG